MRSLAETSQGLRTAWMVGAVCVWAFVSVGYGNEVDWGIGRCDSKWFWGVLLGA